MWLRKDRAGFFFKKKARPAFLTLPRDFFSFMRLQSLSRFDEMLFKSGASTATRTAVFSFFFLQWSASISQQRLPNKTNQDQRGQRSNTNDWQKAARCCPEQLSSHYRWDVHNKAQPWNADREQSLLPPAAGKKNKDGWIFDAWFVNDAEATIKYVFHSLTDRKFTGAPASDSAPRVTRCVSSQDRCVTSLGNNRSVTAACDSTVLAVLWAVSHICHSRKSTGAKKKITFMMVEIHSVALVFSLLLVMVTHCHLFMVYWDTWIERGHRYRH